MEISTIVTIIIGATTLVIQYLFTLALSNLKKMEDAKAENSHLYRQCMLDKLNDVKKSCELSNENITSLVEKINTLDKQLSEIKSKYVDKDTCERLRRSGICPRDEIM